MEGARGSKGDPGAAVRTCSSAAPNRERRGGGGGGRARAAASRQPMPSYGWPARTADQPVAADEATKRSVFNGGAKR